jgi:arabinan endo-1,5-alpha-L-arabinosidase
MHVKYHLFFLFSMATAIASAQGRYTNPVYALDFADPTVIRGHDGSFYAYATNSGNGSAFRNIQVAKSDDLVTWRLVGDALPQKPAWADRDFWAPHVLYDTIRKKYFLYYSGESPREKTGKCIGVAVSDKPEGPFIDSGKPLVCGEGFINIDPMAFDDPATGRKWLYWGSAHLPIRVQELADDRISFKVTSHPVDVVSPRKHSEYRKLIEGAWLHYRNGYYYLFYSGDNCCGDKANYAVMVSRARQADGPFEGFNEVSGKGSTPILIKNAAWLAPGHNSVITDDAGNDWIVYHAISTEATLKEKGRIMLMDKLTYKDDWPAVESMSPSTTPQMTPVINKKTKP